MTPGSSPEDTDDKYKALTKGLKSKSSTEISSASYIASQLNGLEKKGRFEFVDGFGLLNDDVLFDLLPNIETILYQEDWEEFEEMREAGETLSEYDNLDLIALLLYTQEEQGELSGKQKYDLERNRDKIEKELDEIRSEIEH